MLISSGRAVGGRTGYFCSKYLLQGTGILFSAKPDQEWKSLRKASHKHLKQYGEGIAVIQSVIQDVQEDMFSKFETNVGVPFDPKQAIFDAALSNIAFLLTGVKAKTGDQLLEKMRMYEGEAPKFIGGATEVKYMMYDAWPWLRFLRMSTWKHIEGIRDLQEAIYRDTEALSKTHPDVHNLFKVLIAHVPNYDHSSLNIEEVKDTEIQYSENAVKKTLLSLLLAGVTTTSTTFYAIINILAHNQSIQEKLHQEVLQLGKGSLQDPITLDDRANMPYCRAVLFEALRYVTILPVGVPHRTVEDVEIAGFHIPKDTDIMTNLWTLHHDPDFWRDPFVFLPERFLDDDGQLVKADHPNRKNLLPFGAGLRVCLGESMALARLFIWTATFAQRFTVIPASDNIASFTDPRKFRFEGVLRVSPYNVLFEKRQL
jgi:cytochrome P450